MSKQSSRGLKTSNKQTNKQTCYSFMKKNSRNIHAPIYLGHFIFDIYSVFIQRKKEKKINVTGIMTIIPFDHLASSFRSVVMQLDYKNVSVI